MKFFPSGIAKDGAFCNRVAERKRLQKHIEQTRHTVLMAPRRYGKSSLITQVMQDNHYIHIWIDFLSVTTKTEVEEKIRIAVKQLILLLAPDIKKLQLQTIDKVKALSPELNLSAMGQSLTLSLSSDPLLPIDTLLTELDNYAQKVNKKAVLVLDEFQQISEIKEHQSVEAMIRHAVERSQCITYLFSGSNRHMLGEMFGQHSRPLYRLCGVMTLDRINPAEYIPFIQKAAQQRWESTISEAVISQILLLTECHPYYVNALCNEIWLNDNSCEIEEQVMITWNNYIVQHKSMIIGDIIPLPINQKKIIKELSHSPENSLYSVSFSVQLKISSASIRRAIEALLLKDLVFEDEKGFYHVLDPAISYYFKYLQ